MIAGYAFDMRSAFDAGATEHPQIEIRKWFPDAHDFEAFSIQDAWAFNAQDRDEFPPYFRKLDTPFVPSGRRPTGRWIVEVTRDERGNQIERGEALTYEPPMCHVCGERH